MSDLSEKILQQIQAITYSVIADGDLLRGRVEFISNHVEALLGYKPQEFLDDPNLWLSIIHPNDLGGGGVERLTLQMAETGMPVTRMYRVRHKITGSHIWLEDKISPVFGADKGITGYIGVAQDISAATQIREKYFENERHLTVITNSISDYAIIMLDPDGIILSWSKGAERIKGYKPEEIIGRHFSCLYPEEDIEQGKPENNLKVAAAEGRCEDEGWRVRKDGSRFWADVIITRVSDEAGTLMGYSKCTRDITERKRMEQLLLESEERFRSVFMNTAIGIYRTTPDGRILLANPALLRMLGFDSFEELSRRNLEKEGIEPDYPRSEFQRRLESEGEIRGLEAAWKRKDGSTIFVRENTKVIRDRAGAVLYYEGTAEDITERKLITKDLAWKTAFTEAMVESALDGILVVNDQGQTIFQNRRFIALWNMPERVAAEKEDAVRVKFVLDQIKYPDRFIEKLTYLNSHQDEVSRDEIELNDGRVFDRYSAPVIGKDEKYYGRIWTFRDITESKRAAAELIVANKELVFQNAEKEKRAVELINANKELIVERAERNKREAQYQALFDASPDCIIVVNASGNIVNVNHQTESLFGYIKEELAGKPIEILLPDRFKDYRALIRTFASNPQVQPIGKGVQLFSKRKDGTEFPIDVALSPIQTEKELNVIVTVRDVTEKKNLERQFLRAQRLESIGTLAGGIAHDLNNILGPIMMSIDILRNKYAEEKDAAMLDMLSSSAQRGADLVKQVLSFARGVEGEHAVVQILHIVKEIEKIAKETFPRSIEIKTVLSKDLWTISADSTQIHQVLMNLCVNARDAMPNGGTITISAENVNVDAQYARMNAEAMEGRYIVLRITDTGTGISPEILERMFEPFFTTKEVGKGTGLGLSTTHAIIKSHGGFINVYSEMGKGTEFKIFLPAEEGEQPIAPEEDQAAPVGNGELILVVDDEAAIREITKLTLEAYGYTVVMAEDGTAAVAAYVQHGEQIALVITDMMMPFMDGASTIRAIRQINPNARFIAVSGLMQKSDVGASLGDVVTLQKPYTAEKMLKSIYSTLHPA
jgi:PAS domain S-box-containing protein